MYKVNKEVHSLSSKINKNVETPKQRKKTGQTKEPKLRLWLATE